MSYIPIEKIVPQYVDANGKPYSGAVLKAYESGTTRNISFAADTSGASLSSTITLNASGYPTISGNVVIPHLDQNYKLALYPNQASADSNSNAVWVVDNIPLSSTSLSGGQLTGVGKGTTRDSAASVGQIQDGELLYLGTTTGADNQYNASPSPTVTAYNNKMTFMVKIHLTNTINPKPYLQLNNIGNPATNAVIKKLDASKNEIDIEASDMLVGGIYKFQRNSSNDAWILLNPEKSFLINPSIASAANIVKSSFSGYGVSYLERPIEISNGTAVNSINFLKGIVSFDDGSGQVVLESNMVKHLYTTVWEKGTDKGGLFGGAGAGLLIQAEKFYHCFVIYNPTTGEVDCGFDLTLDAQSKPEGFTKYKRVASFKTDINRDIMMGNYIYDRKGGYHFTYNNPVVDIQHVGGGNTKTSKQISVPSVPVLAYIRATASQLLANSYFYIKLFQSGSGNEPIISTGAVDAGNTSSSGYIPTKNSNIDYQYGASGGNGEVYAYTLGWYDPCLYTPIALDFHLAPLSTTSSGTSTNTNTGGTANPSGSNTQIQYNKNGLFGANAGFTYDETTNSASISGKIKIGSLTPSTLLAADADKNIQSLPLDTYPSLTELKLVKGLNTQLQSKLSSLESDIAGKASNAVLIGANAATDGQSGLVPKPLIADRQKYLKGDGTWSSIDIPTNPGGANTQIQFNDSGAFGADPDFTYNKGTDTLLVKNVTSSGTISAGTLHATNEFITNKLWINEQISIKDVNSGPVFVIKAGEGLTANRTISFSCDDSDVNINFKHAANPFTGSTVSTAGTKGLVPAPAAGDQGKYLKADGTWSTVSSGTVTNPAGSNSYIQFNDNGVFGGDADFTYNATTNTLSVPNITSSSLTSLQTQITSNSSNITSLQTSVTSNTNSITTLQGQVSTNSSNITSLQTTVSGKASDTVFIGDSGSGGVKGLVPAPAAGDSAKVLGGNGQWVSLPTTQSVAGSSTQIQFNDGGNFAGNSNFTFDKTTNTLNVTNITSNSLSSLQTSITNNSNSITSLQTSVTSNTNSITTLQGQVTTNTNSISSLQTTVSGKANDTAFTGSTASVNGAKGLVPAPTTSDVGKYLKADGTWADISVSATNPGGANTQVQFNDGGVFGGDTDFTYNKTTNTLTVTGSFNSGALTASQLLASDASKNIQSLPIATYPSLAEIAYVKGVTSSIQTQIDSKAPLASPTFTGTVKGVSIPFSFAISDESTAIATGTSKITFRAPYACTLTAVRASLSTASTSGNPTFDINKNGVSVLSTTLSINANQKTSVTASTQAVISTSSIADDDEITIDIDAAGTGAKGAKITLYLTRV